MIKHAVINAGLGYAQARHGDTVILCDANMPIPNGCHVIDLSLVRGLPTLTQILNAVLNDMVAERHQVFELIPQYNPQMYQSIRELLRRAADLTGRAAGLCQLRLWGGPWNGSAGEKPYAGVPTPVRTGHFVLVTTMEELGLRGFCWSMRPALQT